MRYHPGNAVAEQLSRRVLSRYIYREKWIAVFARMVHGVLMLRAP
jgi:hypothetical protein